MSVTGRKVTLTYCEICKKEVKYFNRHLAKHHQEISQLEYFNTYIQFSQNTLYKHTQVNMMKYSIHLVVLVAEC